MECSPTVNRVLHRNVRTNPVGGGAHDAPPRLPPMNEKNRETPDKNHPVNLKKSPLKEGAPA